MFTQELPILEELVGTVTLPTDVIIGERGLCDLELLLNGALHPVTSFMDLENYKSVIKSISLKDGQIFALPIVLPVPASLCSSAENADSQTIHIRDNTNSLLADLEVTSIFVPDYELEASEVLGEKYPEDPTHPYAKYMKQAHANCFYVGGARLIERHPIYHFDFRRYRLTPAEAKRTFAERKWSTIVGFQTRNPMHRSHFELTRQALADVTAETGEPAQLMLSPAVGPTQPGDVDYRIRVRCYEQILHHYAVEPLLVLMPLAMRMAGPREALHHAIVRKNYGCTHFIVGRDHAGPSVKTKDGESFYRPYDAHELLQRSAESIGIKPVFGKNMVYLGEELGYVQEDRYQAMTQTANLKPLQISGTQFRQMLMKNEPVPNWFCFPDVVAELRAAYVPAHEQGLCVYFTGLPCSGKSTLTLALRALLLENRAERRKVTVLDADIIRTHLSKGLGFSREDRSLNVRRIGYVAQEIVKHGGICLVANIAPYKDDRLYNKHLIESVNGNYVEIYVSTPLEVCEERDIKQLYQKARAGVIKQFTGISDPYEAPEEPDVIVNSTNDLTGKVQTVFNFLKSVGYCKGEVLPAA